MMLDLRNFDEMRRDIENERQSPLKLYALLEREDEPDKWDLVVSAQWVKGATIEDMKYIIDKMKKRLTQPERDSVGHIILLRPDESTVQSILSSSRPVTHTSGIASKDIHRSYVNGMLINRGYILSADSNPNSTSRTYPRHS